MNVEATKEFLPTRCCVVCGASSYGLCCSYLCWRKKQGLPTPAEPDKTNSMTCISCGDTGRNSKGAKPRVESPEVYDGPSWETAETEVFRYGVLEFRECVAAAKNAGVSPVYVLACVDFFKESKPKYKPADLRKRLQNSANHRDPDDATTWTSK